MVAMSIPTTTVSELPDDAVLVDVREDNEWAAGHAPNAVHIPLADLPARLGELPDTDEPVAVVCRMGGRSSRAVQWLAQQGYDVVNVDGGMVAWERAGKRLVAEVDPRVI
jgi:rhodanese-related sulfurtransferase